MTAGKYWIPHLCSSFVPPLPLASDFSRTHQSCLPTSFSLSIRLSFLPQGFSRVSEEGWAASPEAQELKPLKPPATYRLGLGGGASRLGLKLPAGRQLAHLRPCPFPYGSQSSTLHWLFLIPFHSSHSSLLLSEIISKINQLHASPHLNLVFQKLKDTIMSKCSVGALALCKADQMFIFFRIIINSWTHRDFVCINPQHSF